MQDLDFTKPEYIKSSDRSLARRGMEGLSAAQPPHIEITGGKFQLINAAKTVLKTITGHLDVIVLDINANKSKSYYAKDIAFDPMNPQPPLCWSDNGIAPSINAREPQWPTCGPRPGDGKICPHNIWGSGEGLGGSKIKSCKDYKKIAIWTNEERGMQFQLRIPPNSFKYWNAYCGFVASRNADLWEIITRITFSDNKKEPNTLIFDVASTNGKVNWVPASFEAWYKKRLGEHAWDTLIGRDDQPINGDIAALATPAIGEDRNQTLPPARPEEPESPVEMAEDPEPHPPTPPPAPRRGRPPKAAQTALQNNGGPELPEFIRRTSPGMVGDAPAPDAGIGSAIDDAFSS